MVKSGNPFRWVLGLVVMCCVRGAFGEEAWHAPELPKIPEKVVKVSGLQEGESADNTKAVQVAIDEAAKAGGGTVEVPSGRYLCGPLHLANQINLKLDKGATLVMLPMDRYPGGTQDPGNFIEAQGLHDIAITGEGGIDGQGAAWWPLAKTKKEAKRPRMVALRNSERILIEGVTLENSPMFHIAISRAQNVTVRGVTVKAPPSKDTTNPSHNTDACDVSGSHVLVENCNISVGDDDFTCSGPTSDVLIRNNTYGYGHGVSIGSHTNGGISNLTVENCTFTNTECGIRIKADRDRGGEIQHLTYRNLTMKDVEIPILIYTEYMAKEKQYRDLKKITPEIAATYPSAEVTDLTPRYHDFTFSNIKATATKEGRAGLIWGLPEMPVKNVLLQNVEITAERPFAIFCAQGVKVENCKITTPEGVNKLATEDAQVEMKN
ncbi:MAG: glycoside hydrolase family 28 protein [Phycisphaerae bacterium]